MDSSASSSAAAGTATARSGTSLLPAYLALIAAAAFWGGNWPLARWAQELVPAQTLAAVRWCGAALVLLPFVLPQLRRCWPAFKLEWPRLAFLGVLGVTGFSAMSYHGLGYTTAINGSLLNAAAPVFMILFGALGLGDRATRLELAGMVVSMAGVIAIVTRGAPEALARLELNVGDLWVMAAVLAWSLYTLLLKRWRTALPPLVFLFATIVLSLPMPIALSAAELYWGTQMPRIEPATIVTVIYLALFPSVGAYVFWAHGVRRVGPTRATLIQYLIPVFAAVLAITLLGESLRLFHVVGAVLIVGGLVLATRPKPPATVSRRTAPTE